MTHQEKISNTGEHADTLRTRILVAATNLISVKGSDAATTRAVAAAANVQAPAIYRIFGDKRGLLDAVAEHGLATYVAEKAALKSNTDPLEDLRNGWDVHVNFGLSHPGLFTIMSSDPEPDHPSPAIVAGAKLLRARIHNIAKAGRLSVSEDRAVALIHSTCVGTVLTLLRQPEGSRDLGLSEAARESAMAAITGEGAAAKSGPATAAATLRSTLDDNTILSAGEKLLLAELLDRIANESA